MRWYWTGLYWVQRLARVRFFRATNRKKDGKDHRYFSVVENQRVAGGKTIQRTVLYLGEINDQQQAAWRKVLTVFDEQQHQFTNLSLFPDDRELPAGAVDSIQVLLSGLELRRARPFGNCWLASELWDQLGLGEFWRTRLAGQDPPGAAFAAPAPDHRGTSQYPVRLIEARLW